MLSPKLIDNDVRTYVSNSLHTCHRNRIEKYSFILNLSFFIILILSLGSMLYFCWKHQLSSEEKYQRQCQTNNYIKTKIRNHQIELAKKHVSITKLPVLVNDLL